MFIMYIIMFIMYIIMLNVRITGRDVWRASKLPFLVFIQV